MATTEATEVLTPPLAAPPPANPQPPRLLVPLALVFLTVAWWAVFVLNNGIFIDESVYIRTGRAYITHWIYGTPLPDWVGEGFSGLPMIYPVLAGGLDILGGLAAVRLFSLVCILATMMLLRSIATSLFNRRTGLVTAVTFGLTGPVVYVGHLGTFDALVILMLVTAWWLGMRADWKIALLLGPLLALAVATKYTAYVFVPTVLVLSTFMPYAMTHSTTLRTWLHPRLPWSRIVRAAIAGLITAGLLALGYMFTNDTIREALSFTTTGRSALSPTPRAQLAGMVPNFIWPTLFAALLGLVWLLRARRWTAVLWGVVLIGTSLLLPIAQIKLGEGVSFHKHLAYSAAFLAPLAGWGFSRPWKLAIWTPVLVWWLILMGFWGAFRSHDLIQYPDVRPVIEEARFTTGGTYLSSSADSMSYYTRLDPNIEWETTFELYAQGPEAIREAVRKYRYEQIIIHAGNTGSTIQDEGQKVLLKELDQGFYDVEQAGEEGEWLIYTPLSMSQDD